MQNYYIRKLFKKESIEYISDKISEANVNNFWKDGLDTGGGIKERKNNFQMNNPEICQNIHSIIMSSLDNDLDFLNFTVAKSTTMSMITKTEKNGYYKPHRDLWSNGDYSTTVFLNNKNEYDGGELCLYFGGNEETEIKLDAGYAITYNTGIPHRVKDVKSGCRYVAVVWTSSLIKDPQIRTMYNDISKIEKFLFENYSKKEIVHEDICSALNEPLFIITNLKNEILRKYA